MEQSLGKSGFRPGAGQKSGAQTVHRLMMPAVHGKYRAIEGVQEGAFRRPNRMDAVGGFPLVEREDIGRQVLNQGAAQSHVDDLHAPADAQYGLARLVKGVKQGQLPLIQHRVRGLGAKIFLAEQGGVQVPAPAQHQSGAVEIRGRGITGDGKGT